MKGFLRSQKPWRTDVPVHIRKGALAGWIKRLDAHTLWRSTRGPICRVVPVPAKAAGRTTNPLAAYGVRSSQDHLSTHRGGVK